MYYIPNVKKRSEGEILAEKNSKAATGSLLEKICS